VPICIWYSFWQPSFKQTNPRHGNLSLSFSSLFYHYASKLIGHLSNPNSNRQRSDVCVIKLDGLMCDELSPKIPLTLV